MWGGHTGDLQAAPPSKLAFPTASSISIDGHPQVQWKPTISHPPRLGFLSHLTSNPSANAASCLGPESLFLLPLPLPPLVPTAGVTCPGYPGSLWTGLPAPALAPTVSCPQNCGPFRTCLFCSDPATVPHFPQGRSQPPHGLQDAPPALALLRPHLPRASPHSAAIARTAPPRLYRDTIAMDRGASFRCTMP